MFRLPLCYRISNLLLSAFLLWATNSATRCLLFLLLLLNYSFAIWSHTILLAVPVRLTFFFCFPSCCFFCLFVFPACRSLGSDPGSPKKCRARFGLNQQTDWCGPCRWVPELPLALCTVTFAPSASPLLRACITSSPPPSGGFLCHADISHGEVPIVRLGEMLPLHVASH